MSRLCVVLLLLLLAPRASPATILCDGTDDVALSGLPLSAFIGGAGTIAVWVIPTGPATAELGGSAAGEGRHILGDTGGYVGLSRGTQGTDQMWGYLWDGSVKNIGVATVPNSWLQLTWIKQLAGGLALYQNGVLVASIATGNILTLTNFLRICAGYNSAAFFQSHVAAIQTWNVALSQNEAETLGKSRLLQPQLTRAPTAYWPLDDCADGANGDGVEFRDRSGNNRNLTMDNGANNIGATCQASQHLSYGWGPH